MLFNFANVLVFILFSVGFVLANLLIARLIAPRAPSRAKSIPYECGELPKGSPWIRFNLRYFVFALIFIVFEVEIAFIYPCAVVLKRWADDGNGVIALVEIFLFALILIAGLAYAWKKGDLEWVRSIAQREPQAENVAKRA